MNNDRGMSIPSIEQFAGRGAARAARRRASAKRGSSSQRRSFGVNQRPGWGTYIAISIVVIISSLPIYYAILLASSDGATIAQNPLPSLLPQGNLLTNLHRVMTSDINFWSAVQNSVIVAGVTAISVMFFSTLAGFAFSKLRFRGSRPLLLFVIATMAVPTQLGVVPLFVIMSKLEWIGHLQSVIVPGLTSAFGVFWMTQYLEGALPYELIEAARVDGCSMIKTFWHVGLPAARPAMAMLGMFTFVGSWTTFFWPFIALGSQNPTLPVALTLLQDQYFKDYSLIMAGVVITTAPLLLLFIFAGRQVVAGVMQGAVKG